MTIKSKYALIAVVAAVAFGSPALAQSFDPEFGTGNVLSFSNAPTGAPQAKIAAVTSRNRVAIHQNGLHAFAMVPSRAGINSNSPALTGGGSTGYNEEVLAH